MNKRLGILGMLLLALGLSAMACSGSEDKADPDAVRSALLEADKAWASAAASGEMDKVFGYWAEDAVIYAPGMPAVSGKAAILKFVADNRAQRGFTLKWEPRSAHVADSGELGYTSGDYQISVNGPGGTPIVTMGPYLLVWRKTDAGAWECIIEMFTPAGAPPGA